jgi:Actinobacteria/chloroflexi VLRF1 release factor
VAHVLADRTVGVLLVRLGAHAAGIFEGDRLVESKVDRTQVAGRQKAGGWSQQRFARREGRARAALAEAADLAARLLMPARHRLDAVVLGGDRRAMAALRDDRRLGPLFELATQRFLTVLYRPGTSLPILPCTRPAGAVVTTRSRVLLLTTPQGGIASQPSPSGRGVCLGRIVHGCLPCEIGVNGCRLAASSAGPGCVSACYLGCL